MNLTDVVDKGQITMKREGKSYFIEYTDNNEYGNLKTRVFQAKSLRLAYMKLEEYLSYKN